MGVLRANQILQQDFDQAVAVAPSATQTTYLRSCQHILRILGVELCIPAGFTADASAYWVFQLLKGATVVATWSCQTGQEGTIAAATFVNLTMSATDTDAVTAVGDVLSFVATKNGTAAAIVNGTARVYGERVG